MTLENFRLPNAAKDKLLAIIPYCSNNKRVKLESSMEIPQTVPLNPPNATANDMIDLNTSSQTSSDSNKGPLFHLITTYEQKIKEGFVNRVPAVLTLNGSKVNSSSCDITINFKDGKYTVLCPICSSTRTLTVKSPSLKFHTGNLFKHFSSHSSKSTPTGDADTIAETQETTDSHQLQLPNTTQVARTSGQGLEIINHAKVILLFARKKFELN